MRLSLVSLALGAAALALLTTATPAADPSFVWGPPYHAAYYGPATYYYSPSGKHVYVPYTYTYTPSTNLYFPASYSLPSNSYAGGFSPPASNYTSFLPSTAYSDYSAMMFTSNPAQTTTVDLNDNYFQPATLTVRPGTTVRWRNMGLNRHSATSDDGLWDSTDLRPGDSYTATFHQPGRYHYRCRFHEREMQGVVVVQ